MTADKVLHDKSLKTLADNKRWLTEHREQTVRSGDVPVSSDQTSEAPSGQDTQQ